MKKHFLTATLSIALLAFAVSFTSCKGDGKKPDKGGSTTSVEKLTVEPTEMSLKTGEMQEFKVVIEPLGIKYDVSIDNTSVATLEGMKVVAVAEGTATLTVKAGDKTATMSITVMAKEKGNVNEAKVGGDIYFTDPANFVNEKADIYATMRAIGWTTVFQNKETEDSPEWKNSYPFFQGEGMKSLFEFVQYVHNPSKGAPFAQAVGYFQDGTNIYEKIFHEGFETEENNFCKIYGLTFLQRDTLNDDNRTPCVILKKEDIPGLIVLGFAERVTSGDKTAEAFIVEYYIPNKGQSGLLKNRQYDLDALNLNIPSEEELEASTKMINRLF